MLRMAAGSIGTLNQSCASFLIMVCISVLPFCADDVSLIIPLLFPFVKTVSVSVQFLELPEMTGRVLNLLE